MLSRLAEYFIPAHYSDQVEDRRLARLFVLILIYGGLAELVSISTSLYLEFPAGAYSMLGGGVSCLLLLLLFWRGVSLATGVNLYMAAQMIVFFVQSWWGGGLESPGTSALFFLPAITMLLVGKRMATVWLLVSILILLFFFLYEQQAGPIPIGYDGKKSSIYFLWSTFGLLVVMYIITLVFNDEKDRAMNQLIEKNEQLTTTQNQLIQKEKMASLGELTAGIAHEIQNPLNFVNNFSEVSQEMVGEIQDERKKDPPERDEMLEDELLGDLAQNIQKITHHGGRASAIIRSMLEHSRASTGEQQLTDLNALCDEYLRLSYHGLRAKDKSFNCTLTTHFDPDLPKLNVVPQDLGRVLLNLFNNAFYAVQQREKQAPTSSDGKAYRPMVWVSTKAAVKVGVKAPINEFGTAISIRDNGTGIPETAKDKIFQPFFTTKPTGEGTGLGLSLSYDIVTKGHGGEMRVTSVEGEGTEFTISLPVARS